MDFIAGKAKYILHKYHESDPIKLCEAIGILLGFMPMGTYEGACKGFFIVQSKVRMIVVNSDLPRALQRIIIAHELGHALLHCDRCKINTFHDFELFGETSSLEYEANLFAAELLMTDEDVLERLNEDFSFFGTAARLNVPAELLDFKFRVMKRRGFKVVDPPLLAQGNFLKNVEVDGIEEADY